jgi:hypothetical protein
MLLLRPESMIIALLLIIVMFTLIELNQETVA